MVGEQIQILNIVNLAEKHGKNTEKQMVKALFYFMKRYLVLVKKKLFVTGVKKNESVSVQNSSEFYVGHAIRYALIIK